MTALRAKNWIRGHKMLNEENEVGRGITSTGAVMVREFSGRATQIMTRSVFCKYQCIEKAQMVTESISLIEYAPSCILALVRAWC